MASREMPRIFECAICLHDMLERTPRALRCVHTFCEECLKPLLKDDQIICPSCRKTTKVESKDIKELPVNFILCQMKEFAGCPESVSGGPQKSCEICKTYPSIFMCEDCPRFLCMTCKKAHSDIKKFEGHCVCEICQKHGEIVRYICTKCFCPMCEICSLNHQLHQDHIGDFHEIFRDLKYSLNGIKSDIKIAQEKYDDNFVKLSKRSTVNEKLLKDLVKKRDHHLEMVSQTNGYIAQSEDSYANYNKIQSEYEKTKFKCEKLKNSLETLEVHSSRLKHFPSLQKQTEEILDLLRRDLNAEFFLPSFLQEVQDLKLDKPLPPIKKSENLGFSVQMALLDEDIIAIVEDKPSHVVRISKYGFITLRYYPEIQNEMVRSIAIHDDKIYIAQDQRITVLSKNNNCPIEVIKPKVEQINKILVVDWNNIFISSMDGKIYQHSTDRLSNDVTVPVTQGLINPSYLNYIYDEENPKYIVSGDRVKVYSKNWDVLYTLSNLLEESEEELLLNPQDIAVTDQNTILIADKFHNRISHFTAEGKFLSHILKGDDGISKPTGLLYHNNVLCVCSHESGDIQRFQLQYKPRTKEGVLDDSQCCIL